MSDLARHSLRHRTRPLNVWVAGEGPPLLFLHGWGLSGRAYRGAILALADRGYRVVAPSIAVTDNWSLSSVAEIAAEAMAGMDAAPAPIVGHSFGGNIGMALAHDHPDFVSALIAVNSPLVTIGGLRLGRILLPGGHFRLAGHSQAAMALVRSAASPGGMGALMRSARHFLSAGHENALAELAARGLPRAVVWAERDTLLPATIGVRSAELLGVELTWVRDDESWLLKAPPDHDWPFRAPGHFADRIEGLLSGLLPRTNGAEQKDAPA